MAAPLERKQYEYNQVFVPHSFIGLEFFSFSGKFNFYPVCQILQTILSFILRLFFRKYPIGDLYFLKFFPGTVRLIEISVYPENIKGMVDQFHEPHYEHQGSGFQASQNPGRLFESLLMLRGPGAHKNL